MPNPLGRALRNVRAGHDTLVWARPRLAAPEDFSLTSPAFADGSPIPDLYRGHLRGGDVSPPLAWTAPPEGTVELVLVAQDPDVPFPRPATHALAVGIGPLAGTLAEGALAVDRAPAGVRIGKGAFGRRGWSGPMPPPGHGPHAYVFQLFAADRALDLPDGFGLREVVRALEGHVVARARLTGTYENG